VLDGRDSITKEKREKAVIAIQEITQVERD